jgi:hypothetical protein
MVTKGLVLRVVAGPGGWTPRWSDVEDGGQSQEVFDSDPHLLS